MTVSSGKPRYSYSGNGTTTSFAYGDTFFAPSDLQVMLFDMVAQAWVTPFPSLNGSGTYDYTVQGTFDAATGEYDAGANIVFNTAPPSTYKVVIFLQLPFTQSLDLQDNSKYPAVTLNDALDRVTLLAKETHLQSNVYALVAHYSDEPGAINMTLPPKNVRGNSGAGSYLGFDGTGNPVVLQIPVTQQLPMQGLIPKTVTGASYTYSSADYGRLVIRSNGGSAMADVMPAANAGGGLGASTTIAIRNDDPAAFLQFSAMPIGPGTPTTIVDGQVPQRSDGNSLGFIAPGRAAIFAYDTSGATPAWRDTTRALFGLATGDVQNLAQLTGFENAMPSVAGPSPNGATAQGAVNDFWTPRLAQLEALTGPLAVDFQNVLYRVWGTTVSSGSAWTWVPRTGAANYPRDSVPFTNFSNGVQRLVAAGQVIERGATNLANNPGMTGATVGVVGSGGVLPTGWSIDTLSGNPGSVTQTVVVANTPDGTYNTARIRITLSGTAVNASTLGLRLAPSPGVQIPAIALGGVNFSAIAQVVSSSGQFTGAALILRETASDGTTFIGTTTGDAIPAAFGATKNRCWRAVPQNNYADCQLLCTISGAGAWSVTFDILAPQLEDSANLLDYTSFTASTRGAENITLQVPTSGGMGNSDLFLQAADRGVWARNNASGNVSVTAALMGVGYSVLARARAYAAGTLGWARSWQTAFVLEPTGTPESNAGGWTELKTGALVQLGGINRGLAWWNTANADSGAKSWACQIANTKQGAGLVRLELRQGDAWSGDGSSGLERTMLTAWDPSAGAPPSLPLYQFNWVAFSFYIDPNPGAPLSGLANNNNWLRFHNLASGAANGNPLSLELTPAAVPGGDGEHLAVQILGANLTVNGVTNPGTYYPYTTPFAISRGVWHDLAYKVKIDEHLAGSGYVDLYLDGVLIYSYRGPIGWAGDPPHVQHQVLRPNPLGAGHETLAIRFASMDTRTDGTGLTVRANGTFPDVV